MNAASTKDIYSSMLDLPSFSPREIVSELDRFIIGQNDAKRAVAIALRNRWRRQQLPAQLQEEIYPKNILMIGPTGVGKTEIARRLAKLAQAPFLKIEATKFTEVGYVGKDVESIIRDLVEVSVMMTRERLRRTVEAQAELAAEDRVLAALVGEDATDNTKATFRKKLREGELGHTEVDIEMADTGGNGMPTFEIPGMPGAAMGMINLSDMLGKAMGPRTRKRRLRVEDAYDQLISEEADKLLDEERMIAAALQLVQQNGIVFIDEIDKIAARQDVRGGDVSREGVQRDLLPLIEGTTVMTKYGAVKTDHILFIASGAFHHARPSDLLAELQGRLPIRVELKPLDEKDFLRILTETDASLLEQYEALIGTEGVKLTFDEKAVSAIARLAFAVNESVENIGARRLHTVLEKLLDDISFTATERSGEDITITAELVEEKLADLTQNADLSRFIL